MNRRIKAKGLASQIAADIFYVVNDCIIGLLGLFARLLPRPLHLPALLSLLLCLIWAEELYPRPDTSDSLNSSGLNSGRLNSGRLSSQARLLKEREQFTKEQFPKEQPLLKAILEEVRLELVKPIESVERSNPQEHPDLILEQAYRAHLREEYEKALELYRRFFAAGGGSAYSFSCMGLLLAQLESYEEALLYLEKAVEADPQNLEYVVQYAELLKTTGEARRAWDFLQERRYDFQAAAPALEFHLGELNLLFHNFRQARLNYMQVLFHIRSDSPRANLYRNLSQWRLAHLNIVAQDFEAAERNIRDYLSYDRDHLYLRYVLAKYIYFQKGRFEQARLELELLLSSDPAALKRSYLSRPHIAILLLHTYFVLEDPKFIQLAHEIDKEQELSSLDKALLFTWKGRESQALHQLLAVKRTRENDYVARIAIARLLSARSNPLLHALQLKELSLLALQYRRYREGIAFARQALALKEQHPEIAISRAELFQLLAGHYQFYNQYRRAAFYIQRAIEHNDTEATEQPESADRSRSQDSRQPNGKRHYENLILRARLLRKVDIDLSLKAIASAQKRDPDRAEAYLLQGEIFLSRDNPDRAIDSFTKAIERDSDNISSYLLRGGAQLYKRSYRLARKDADHVLQIRRNFAPASNLKAYSYALESVRLEQGIELLQPVIEKEPINGHYQDTLGWLYFQKGDFPRARYHLELAVNLLNWQEPAAIEALGHLAKLHLALGRKERAAALFTQALQLIEEREQAGENVRQALREEIEQGFKAL